MQVAHGEPASHFLEPRRREEAATQAGVGASERSPPVGSLGVSGGGQPGCWFSRAPGAIVDGEKESTGDTAQQGGREEGRSGTGRPVAWWPGERGLSSGERRKIQGDGWGMGCQKQTVAQMQLLV